jgi:hypothetical protein
MLYFVYQAHNSSYNITVWTHVCFSYLKLAKCSQKQKNWDVQLHSPTAEQGVNKTALCPPKYTRPLQAQSHTLARKWADINVRTYFQLNWAIFANKEPLLNADFLLTFRDNQECFFISNQFNFTRNNWSLHLQSRTKCDSRATGIQTSLLILTRRTDHFNHSINFSFFTQCTMHNHIQY